MLINENILSKITEEVIYEATNSYIDNFDKVIRMMDIKNPDDFYFVQIIKRFKDNPHDDKRKGNYHAGAWYLKGYRIHSTDELLSKKPEIIAMCDQNNARAYITLNKRSDIETDRQIVKVRKMYPKHDARHIHADDIVPAQAKNGPNWVNVRPVFMIDIDASKDDRTKDGKNIWDTTLRIVKDLNITILDTDVTPSGGLHIICSNKNESAVRYLQHLLSKEIDNGKNLGRMATSHVNFDAKRILYSNVTTPGY